MFKCKLYYWEEYETPIGRLTSINVNDKPGTAGEWQYKYEKIKNYFKERIFKTQIEANDYGQEQMYNDHECQYDIEEIKDEE